MYESQTWFFLSVQWFIFCLLLVCSQLYPFGVVNNASKHCGYNINCIFWTDAYIRSWSHLAKWLSASLFQLSYAFMQDVLLGEMMPMYMDKAMFIIGHIYSIILISVRYQSDEFMIKWSWIFWANDQSDWSQIAKCKIDSE